MWYFLKSQWTHWCGEDTEPCPRIVSPVPTSLLSWLLLKLLENISLSSKLCHFVISRMLWKCDHTVWNLLELIFLPAQYNSLKFIIVLFLLCSFLSIFWVVVRSYTTVEWSMHRRTCGSFPVYGCCEWSWINICAQDFVRTCLLFTGIKFQESSC